MISYPGPVRTLRQAGAIRQSSAAASGPNPHWVAKNAPRHARGVDHYQLNIVVNIVTDVHLASECSFSVAVYAAKAAYHAARLATSHRA